jgi:hypothetical protein
MGPYAKGLRYQEGYAAQWQWLINAHPEVLDGSTGQLLFLLERPQYTLEVREILSSSSRLSHHVVRDNSITGSL